MSGGTFTSLLRILLVFSILQKKGTSSMEMTCTVSSTADRTFYSISGDFESKADCHYHWSHDNNPLASSNAKKDDSVISSNSNHLNTSTCYNEIKYVLECSLEEHNTTCRTNCSQSAGMSGVPVEEKGSRHHWIIIGVSVVFLVVSGILCFRGCHSGVNQQKNPV